MTSLTPPGGAPAHPQEPHEALKMALRLAKEATNGWACYAERQIEHKEIDRLHRAIRKLEELADV